MALGLSLSAGCGGAPPESRRAAFPTTTARAAPAPPPSAVDVVPRLEISIAPKLSPRPMVAVRLRAAGSPSDLAEFFLARAPLDSVSAVQASDMHGPIAVAQKARGDGVIFTLARQPAPPVELKFERAAATQPADRLGVSLDPNRFAASGEALFALPLAWTERPTPIQVDVDATQLGPGTRVASSLGLGRHRALELSIAALRRTTFLAGQMGHAVLDGPEGHDEVAWLGYTSFDPRSVAAEVASFRTAAREYFGERRSAPFTLLLVADGRPAGSFDVLRQTGSAVVNVGLSQAYGGPLRVAVAHQLLREWMGPVLWVGPEGAERRGESLWFVEGVTRFLARELCFRFGLLTPTEYLAEVDEIERLLLTSPDARLDNAALAKRAVEPAVAALLVARGARHASGVDARIRHQSAGKRSLDSAIRELYSQAVRSGGPLAESAWVSLLGRELGSPGAGSFSDEIGAGRLTELPGDALGPCFGAGPRRFESHELGFAVVGDLAELPTTVSRVVGASAAERAGLRVGDRIVKARYLAGSTSVPVLLGVVRAGDEKRIEYRPVGAVARGRGFTRLARVPDERCVRR